MKTQRRSTRACIGALATAIALTGMLANVGSAHANHAKGITDGTTTISLHMGPGTGSVKSPPFYDAAYFNQKDPGDLAFHTNDYQPAQRTLQQSMGPGLCSVKASGIH